MQNAVMALCVILVMAPVAPLVLQAFSPVPLYAWRGGLTLGNFQNLFTLPEISDLAGNTLLFCAISITFSIVFGVALAIIVARTDIPARKLLTNILLWPIFVSPLVIGFGAILTYGPTGYVTSLFTHATGIANPWNIYSLTGLSLISGLSMAPMTILYCLSSAQQQDPRLEQAARVAGASPFRTMRRITLPMMRPALIFSFAMNIVAALEMFAIPLLLGGPSGIRLLTTFIYDKGFESGRPDYGLVSAASLILLVLVALLVLLQTFLLRSSHRFLSVGPKGGRMDVMGLGAWKWGVFAATLLYALFGIVAIVFGLFLRSFVLVLSPYISPLSVLTLKNYHDIWLDPTYRHAISNTVMLAIGGAFAGVVVTGAIALVAQRSNYRLRRVLDMMVQLPRAVPGLIVSLGVFYAVIFIPGLSLLSGTLWVLGLAYIVRHLPAGYGIIAPALLQVTKDFDRAANVAGARWSTTMRRIVAPILKPALLSCFTLLMILFFKEYAAAIFLYRPGNEVISMAMLNAWVPGYTGVVASLAVIQIALTTLLLVIFTRLFGVRLNG
ncbi:MAG: hypothetical protein BGP06_14795 [Rhizobiales bacterium 65-9]|nr:MAG: hypothetical protein BGP06_14795 [Rhizobiales bacterium 65-9]